MRKLLQIGNKKCKATPRWSKGTWFIQPLETISAVQFNCWVMSNSLQPHESQHSRPPCPSPTQLPEFPQTHVHWVGDAIQPSHPLFSPSSAFNLSQHQGLFQWVTSSHQVAKYWSFNFSISSSNEYSGLISLRMNWMDLLAVQETLQESSPTQQFKSINSSVLSFLYSPTLKSIHDHRKNHSFD